MALSQADAEDRHDAGDGETRPGKNEPRGDVRSGDAKELVAYLYAGVCRPPEPTADEATQYQPG